MPQNYGENVTTVAAIGLGGVQAPMTVNGAVDGRDKILTLSRQ